jgi:hypothetical protein
MERSAASGHRSAKRPHLRPRAERRALQMSPISRIALLCVVVGSLLNIIVAWAVAIKTQAACPGQFSGNFVDYDTSVHALGMWWEAEHRGRAPAPEHHFARAWRFGCSEVVAGRDLASGEWRVLQTVEAGWPNRSLRGARWMSRARPYDVAAGSVVAFEFRLLPYIPTIGFLRNLITFSGLPFASIVFLRLVDEARRTARARHEMRRGCCPVCRYNLRGNLTAGCPESDGDGRQPCDG